MNLLVTLLLSALLVAVTTGRAQTPALSKSVTIDVADNAGDSSTLDSWRSVYGSSSRTKATVRELTINVRNMSGTLPGAFEVEWYFIGKQAAGTRRFLYDKGSRQVALKPGAFEKMLVQSKELSNYRYHSVYSGYTYRSGDKADGWIVRVKSGGEIIRVKASNAQLEQLEKNKEEFAKFLQKPKTP